MRDRDFWAASGFAGQTRLYGQSPHKGTRDPEECDQCVHETATLIRQTEARVLREIRARITAWEGDVPERERTNLLWRDAVLTAIGEPPRRRTTTARSR